MRFVWSELRRNLSKTLLFIIALSLIFGLLPIALASLQNTHEQIETDITDYARGSYDLLVRPLGERHPLEEELGIVPENYLGFGHGGITIDQWEDILQRDDIEIAAPVASLGYYTGIKSNIGHATPEQSTRYVTTFTTTDGINEYVIDKENICVLLEAPDDSYVKQSYRADFEHVYIDSGLANYCKPDTFLVSFPTTYHLLVGIAPEQEELLTGINFKPLDPENGAVGWGHTMRSESFPIVPTVPVLELEDVQVSLGVQSQIDTLDIDAEQTATYREQLHLVNEQNVETGEVEVLFSSRLLHDTKYDWFFDELLTYPADNSLAINVDLSQLLTPYHQEAILVHNDGEIEYLMADGTFEKEIDLNDASTYFTTGYVNYEQSHDGYAIKQVGHENGIPMYRDVEKHGISVPEHLEKETEPPFIIDPVGAFTVQQNTDQLASSPLGIYSLAPINYINEEKDEVIELVPTATPGSFVSPPTSGVTNIESATLIKGDQPIDAIRVKVAGIEGYTAEAAEKIESIAEDIEAMGLQVSIIAGASPQTLQLDVEGVGTVEEMWTTLGAAGTILSMWNFTNIILASLFLCVALVYMFNRFLFWQMNQQGDLTLKYQLGWEKNDLFKTSRLEATMILLCAWLVSGLFLVVIKQQLHLSMLIYVWHLMISLITFLWYALGIKRKIKHMDAHKGFYLNKRVKHSKSKYLLFKNIGYYWVFIRTPMIQYIVVSALSTFVYLSLTDTVQSTDLTLLGQYINMSASKWHVLLIVSAYILAAFTLIESLISLFVIRKSEISTYQTIGWKLKDIFKLYMKEIALWSFIAIGIGSLFSFVGYAIFYTVNKTVWYVLVLSFGGFYGLTLLIATVTMFVYLSKYDTKSVKTGKIANE